VAPEPHPELAPLSFLLGVWQGEGNGDYPTTEPFRYREKLRFEDVGDTFLLFSQQSWSLPGGEPLHFERGVLRTAGPRRVELTLAHPLGVVEVSEGSLEGASIELTSTAIARTATGSPVSSLARRYRVRDDVLSYEVDMALDDVASTLHVWASLRRT
jgi:THAP4-like, heme-binding beta-barrel domain